MKAKAFILAAGFGSRMMPLTKYVPKPLLPICGVPLIEYSFALCAKYGIGEVVVNAHHLSSQILKTVPLIAAKYGIEVLILVEEGEILGTGGGMRKALDFLNDPYVVLNGDILCNADLNFLLDGVGKDWEACLLLRVSPDAASKGIVAVDETGRLVKLRSIARMEDVEPIRLDTHFTGIHALTLNALKYTPELGYSCIARSAYRDLVPKGLVKGVYHDGIWVDVGNPAVYLETNMAILNDQKGLPLDPTKQSFKWLEDQKILIGPNSKISSKARLLNNVIVGANVEIRPGAQLSDCVILDNAIVPGEWLHRAIIYKEGVIQV